ncbi:MAG: host attachment protein [Betaproteobacteria bacterium]|nr:host attachment protein [Betaproteobacteria bacterium]
MTANRTCVVVADAKVARFYGVEAADTPRYRVKLVERLSFANPDVEAARKGGAGRVKTERVSNRQAGDMHPIDARRQQHRLELERRFGHEIARQIEQIARNWHEATIVLVADPQLLGLMRESLRKALHPGIELKELAKDYTHLTPSELRDRLGLNSLVQPAGGTP